MRWDRWLRIVLMLVVSAMCAAACTSPTNVKVIGESGAAVNDTTTSTPAASAPPALVPDPAPEQPGDEGPVEGCDRNTIGEESGSLAVAYGVEDGQIAALPCLGEPSLVVETAWLALASITPPQLIDGVTIVAGFDDANSDTLAFAGPVANDSDEHLIAVGITAAVEDPQELRLTMAHELAHVFTQTSDQIDVALFADECDTFFNGFGCFQQDAYITEWVDRFWSPVDLSSLPSDFSVDIPGGELRCAIDPGFPGSYAASHPEEDFAESFSAFIFDVEMPSGFDERMNFFEEHPVFVAMRQAIRRSAEPAPPSNFDVCG